MHDHGIPDRPGWPDGVLEAVAQFRQGDLVRDLPLFYWADPMTPVHERTRAYSAEGTAGPEVVTFAAPAPYGMVTTQTCDLALEGDGPPNTAWVQLAPVFNGLSPRPENPDLHLLDGGVRNLVRSGRGYQNLLFIPQMPEDGFWFVDLTFEVPAERGWLARQERIDGFGDETRREEVGRRLAWLRSRPALGGRFVAAVQKPIADALRVLRVEEPAVYDEMHEKVLEVGFELTTRLSVSAARLCVIHDGAPEALLDWWRTLWTTTLTPNADTENFTLFPLEVEDVHDLSVANYRRLTRLPLVTISPNPEWFGPGPEGFGA